MSALLVAGGICGALSVIAFVAGPAANRWAQTHVHPLWVEYSWEHLGAAVLLLVAWVLGITATFCLGVAAGRAIRPKAPG